MARHSNEFLVAVNRVKDGMREEAAWCVTDPKRGENFLEGHLTRGRIEEIGE